MKPVLLIGLILIIPGALALTCQGITYTSRKKILDPGHLQVSAETRKAIPLPPLFGGLAIVGGIVMVIVGRKKT